jgi:hypothetical protein
LGQPPRPDSSPPGDGVVIERVDDRHHGVGPDERRHNQTFISDLPCHNAYPLVGAFVDVATATSISSLLIEEYQAVKRAAPPASAS